MGMYETQQYLQLLQEWMNEDTEAIRTILKRKMDNLRYYYLSPKDWEMIMKSVPDPDVLKYSS